MAEHTTALPPSSSRVAPSLPQETEPLNGWVRRQPQASGLLDSSLSAQHSAPGTQETDGIHSFPAILEFQPWDLTSGPLPRADQGGSGRREELYFLEENIQDYRLVPGT